MFCYRCGAENDAGARFCTTCGQPLGRFPDVDAERSVLPGSYGSPGVGESPAPSATDGGSSAEPVRRRGPADAVVAIVVAALAVVALVVALAVVAVRRGGEQPGGQPAVPEESEPGADASSSDDEGEDASDEARRSTSRTLDQSAVDAVVDGYSTTDVAVSVITQDGLRSYSSRNAERRYVAAGLYLPVYLAYTDTNPGRPSDSAGQMLRSMDNEAANALIDDIGGLDGLNSWLADHRYAHTSFGRVFGDVAASQEGRENYTSSDDAARMLAETIDDGAYLLMNHDIATEGVDVPQGATVHAHRGAGIQDAYNYFVVIGNGEDAVGVAVITEHLGREQAAALTSDILDAVWTTMLDAR